MEDFSGLDSFLDGDSTEQKVADIPAAESETVETPAEETVETKTEDKTETTKEDKTDKTESGDKETTEKADEKSDDKSESSDFDWDVADNPYKAELEKTKAEAKSSRDWATQINSELAELKRQGTITQQKVDGTYDEEAETAQAEDPAQLADLQGRIKASQAAAIETYGAEKVDELINTFSEQYGQDMAVQARVAASDSPIKEAIKVLNEGNFRQKWGGDVLSAEGKIREDERTRLTAEITAKVTAEIQAKIKQSGENHIGLSGLSGSSAVKADDNSKVVPDSLSALFD